MILKYRSGTEIQPRTIWCLGRNYALHAAELGNPLEARPLVFQKGLNAVHPFSGEIKLPRDRGVVHFETELVLHVERRLDKPVIAGLAVGLDLTLRDVQSDLKKAGKPWALAKSFDSAATITEFLDITDFPDLQDIRFSMKLNGETRQSGNSTHMILPMVNVLDYLGEFTQLQTGDLVFTGSPEGVGPVEPGDTIEVTLEDRPMGIAAFV